MLNTVIDTLAASKLTGTVATSNGGTGLSAIGTALQVLRVNAGATGLEWATVAGVTPGGSNTQVQYNNAGAFAGSAGLLWNEATDQLTIGDGVAANPMLLITPTGSNDARIQCGANGGGISFRRHDGVQSVRFSNAGQIDATQLYLGTTNYAAGQIARSSSTRIQLNNSASSNAIVLDSQSDTTTTFVTMLHVVPNRAACIGQVIKLAASHTANAFEVQPSGSSTPLYAVDAAGHPVIPIYAGAPGTTPANGALAVDSTNNRLYVRVGGVWRYATLT